MTFLVMSPPEKNRFAYLDGLRGWAALLVVFHHGIIAQDFGLFTGQQIDSRGTWDMWIAGTPFSPFATGGSLTVCIFFALSGFVLAHAYSRSRQSWLALAGRRYARLGLPMLAGCLLAWMLLSLGLMRSQPAALITHSSWLGGQFDQQPDLLAAITEPIQLFVGSFPSSSREYDSALWTMPIEADGSLVLMTIFVFLRRTGRHLDRLAGYAFCLFAVLGAGSFLSLFAFGAALRLLQPTKMSAALGGSRWALVALLLLGLFFGTVPFGIHRWAIYEWLTALATHVIWHARFWLHSPVSFWHGIGAALILLAVCSCPSMQSALSRPFGRFLGRISFPLYILHVPLLMVIECDAILLCQHIGMPPLAGGVLSLAVFVVVAVAVAATLTPLIEGGAINLSFRLGAAIDAHAHRVEAQVTSMLGRRPPVKR